MSRESFNKLREPFPPSKIQHLDNGRGLVLDYVGHADVTERLLDVDPEWTWEPVGYTPNGLPAFDEHGGLWIKLTVCGVTRYGYGEPQGRDEWDKVKGAIGNAIRVAAMRFGVGLHLWQKEAPAAGNVFDRIAAKAVETALAPDEWKRPERANSNGGKLVNEKQVKLVWIKCKEANLHKTSEQLQALTQLLNREVNALDELHTADVDIIVRAGVDGIQKAYWASMGLELTEEPTPADDPWSTNA